MALSKHFILQEFVPPEIYKQFGDHAWQFIDPRLIVLADFVRDFFSKPVTINNWDSGGTLTMRGFRTPDTSVGGTLSQHKFGRAIDININDLTPVQIYSIISESSAKFMKAGLTTMENINFTTSWNHLDIRYTGMDSIKIVTP